MWGELDNAMRVSVIFGFAMGSFQLLLAFPLYQLWPAFLSPVVLVELVENPYSIIWIVIFAAVTLTPFFLLGATIALMLKPLSPESKRHPGLPHDTSRNNFDNLSIPLAGALIIITFLAVFSESPTTFPPLRFSAFHACPCSTAARRESHASKGSVISTASGP